METSGMTPLKVGEPFVERIDMAIPSQAGELRKV